MTVKEIITMLLERGMALQTFWGFYITVALGAIAFFGSAQRSKRLGALVTVIFLAFATVNLMGMSDIARQRAVLYETAAHLGEPGAFPASEPEKRLAKSIIEISGPFVVSYVVAFHLAADALVLIAIWFLLLSGASISPKPAESSEKRCTCAHSQKSPPAGGGLP